VEAPGSAVTMNDEAVVHASNAAGAVQAPEGAALTKVALNNQQDACGQSNEKELEDAIFKMKDFEDAIARMSQLDPRVLDGHLDFIQVTLMTDVNREAEIMRHLKTVELRDNIEKSKKLLAERDEKKRKDRKGFELVKVKRHEKEKKARKLAQLNKKALSKKRSSTHKYFDLVATNVAAEDAKEEEKEQQLDVAIEEKKMTRQDGNDNLQRCVARLDGRGAKIVEETREARWNEDISQETLQKNFLK
jgi:hypothetical protein